MNDLFQTLYQKREELTLALVSAWVCGAAAAKLFPLSGEGTLLLPLLIGCAVFLALFTVSLATRGGLAAGKGTLLLSSLLLCLSFCWDLYGKQDDHLAFLAAAAVLALVLMYVLRGTERFSLPDRGGKLWFAAALACALVFAARVGLIGAFRYLTYHTPTYDFGIFAQIFWSLRDHFSPDASCERDQILSHFAVHLSPALYFLLPFYLLFPYPATVQILQSAALAAAVVPLWLICRRMKLTARASFAFCFLYLIHPALIGGCMYDFHENCLLPLFLFSAILFAEKGGKSGAVWAMVFSLFTCMIKEDAAVYVAFLALFLLLSGRRRALGGAMLALSLLYFLFACWYIDTYGLGIMSYRYQNVSSDGSLIGVIVTALTDPMRVIRACFTAEKLECAAFMLLPLGLLPFASKKVSRFILLGGLILVNLMPDYVYQHSIDFQYVFGSLALLVYASVLNYTELASARRYLAALAVCAALLTASMRFSRHSSYLSYPKYFAAETEIIGRGIALVPEGESVSVSTFLAANLSNRRELYLIEGMRETDWVVVDLRYGEWQKYPGEYAKLGYETVFREDGYVCVMKKGK